MIETLADVPVLARARQVAYTTLRDVLSEQLAPLYAELLALLPISHAEVTHQSETAAPQPEPAAPQLSELPPAAVEGASPSTPPATAPGTLSRLTGSLMDFFRSNAAPAGTTAPPGTVPSASMPAPGMPGGQPSGGMPGGTAPGGGAMPGGAMPGGAMSGGSMSGGSMPSTGAAGQGMPMPPLGVANSPVLQRLAAAGAIPPAITQEMQRSVDMFGALFEKKV